MIRPMGKVIAARPSEAPQWAGDKPVVFMKGPPNSTRMACKTASKKRIAIKSFDLPNRYTFHSSVSDRALIWLKI